MDRQSDPVGDEIVAGLEKIRDAEGIALSGTGLTLTSNTFGNTVFTGQTGKYEGNTVIRLRDATRKATDD